MFTRLVLTNSDLLHLVTRTLDLEHQEIGRKSDKSYFFLDLTFYFRILPPITMPGTRLTPVSGRWSRLKATADTEAGNRQGPLQLDFNVKVNM